MSEDTKQSESGNPYASPDIAHVAPRRRTKWRIIAVTLFVVFGFIGVVNAPLMFLVGYSRLAEHGGGFPIALAGASSLVFTGSVLWFASALLCWKGKWRWMILSVVAAYGTAVLGHYLMTTLGLGWPR